VYQAVPYVGMAKVFDFIHATNEVLTERGSHWPCRVNPRPHVDEGVNDAIDAAYRTKYHRYADSYVTHMIRPEARATTIKLIPR